MADTGRIGRVTAGSEPKLIYVRPGDAAAADRARDWMFGPGNSMKNYDELVRPLEIGEKQNLDEYGAQNLLDAMRLRMQLPR